MNLLDIVGREPCPLPWTEVSKIPWDDPAFSTRMLAEHLSQDHDAASRKSTHIDRQVEWIHTQCLGERPSSVLDLGCGPGLYCTRLARLGHHCTGLDFGPASIEYARQIAAETGLDCEYIQGDLRDEEYGSDRDLIMLLFGELNTFQRTDSAAFLSRAREALAESGRVILEVHTLDSIRERGMAARFWTSMEHGLFSDEPYLRLDDACWHEDSQTTVERHFIIDAESGEVSLYGTTTQAYTRPGYEDLLREAGFTTIEWRSDWPNPVEQQQELSLIVASP